MVNALVVQEIVKGDLKCIEQGRVLFLDYFKDLYKNISETTLQINNTTEKYLASVFARTERALQDNQMLTACLAYYNGTVVGFTVFGPLEESTTILIHTLPIALDHKKLEINIRLLFMNYVSQKFPETKQIIIMVRKANVVHEQLCYQTGCARYNDIFDQSTYIRMRYDKQCYNGYVYTRS